MKEATNVNPLASLEEKAMLAHVEIHFYGFRKYDREVSDEAAKAFDAEEDSGRFNKSLIEREGIKYLNNISGDIRRYHKRNTLPWSDDGARILPSQHFVEYSRGLQKRIEEFNKECDSFCKKLPQLYGKAQKKLGKMYKKEEYPEPSTIRERYWVRVRLSPVPVGKDFRVTSLGKSDLEKIRKEIDTQRVEAVKEATRVLWIRLQRPISKMVERLSDKKSIFRDTLVKNIADMVEMIPKLNLGDPELEKFRKDIERKLCGTDPKALRKDEKFRKDTRKVAKEILDKMAAYV